MSMPLEVRANNTPSVSSSRRPRFCDHINDALRAIGVCAVAAMVLAFTAVGLAQSENDTLVYSEDFESSTASGWSQAVVWSVEPSEGGLAFRGDGSGHAHISYTADQWGNSLLRLRFRLEGDFAHVSYRDGGTGRYFLSIREEEVVLNKQLYPDTFLGNLALGAGVTLGVWHTLEVDGTDGSLVVTIDGAEVLTYEDPQPLQHGAISLESFDDEFWVDDINVYIPQSALPPEPPPGLTWVRTGGPLGGLGYDIRIHPEDHDLLFVTDAFAGVFRSIDGGKTWEPANTGISTRTGGSGDAIPIFCLTIDPNNSDIIWCGTSGVRGIYKSTDRGDQWSQKDNGVVEEEGITFRGFTVEPGNSHVVYAAAEVSSWVWSGSPLSGREFDLTQGVVYKTIDGGENWNEIWRDDNLARYVWIDPDDTDVIYVSTGIFDREAANSDPDGANRAASAGGVGVVKSTDGGVTWDAVNNGLGNLYVGSLFMHPQDARTLIAGTGNNQYYHDQGVYITTDGGVTWQQTLIDDSINAVEFAVTDPDIVYAGSAIAIYRSTDGGFTWDTMAGGALGQGWGPPGVRAGFPIDFQIDPEDPDRLFVNNYGGGNFLSADRGQTWAVASQGYTGAQVRAIAADQTEPGRVFAAARSGLFKTLDGGGQWTGQSYDPAAVLEWYAVAIDPQDNTHILAASNWDGILFESRDSGASWTIVGSGLGEGKSWRAITFAPADPQVVYTGTSAFFSAGTDDETLDAAGIYVSYDGGESWIEANDATSQKANVTALAIQPDDSDTVYAATGNGGLLKTTNGGGSWAEINTGLPAALSALAVVIHPQDHELIFAGLTFGGLYRSEDGGGSWQQSGFGMNPQASVSDIVIDPTAPATMYAADRLTGVYLSEDGGQSWAQITDGLRTRNINALAISADGQHLYAASEGEGVFRLDLSGDPPPEAEEPDDVTDNGGTDDVGADNENVNENGDGGVENDNDNQGVDVGDDITNANENSTGGGVVGGLCGAGAAGSLMIALCVICLAFLRARPRAWL